MKMLLSLLVSSLLISPFAPAQFHVGYGVKAGAGSSTIHMLTDYETILQGHHLKKAFSAYAGLTATLRFSRFFYIQPELLYSLRGCTYNGNETGTFRTHTVSIPLMFGFKPVKFLSLMIGPEGGYILAATDHNNFQYTNKTNVSNSIDRRLTISADVGIAISILPNLAIEARYINGITNLFDVKVSGSGPTSGSPGYTSVIGKSGHELVAQFGAVYTFK